MSLANPDGPANGPSTANPAPPAAVSILVLPGSSLMCVAAASDPLRAANRLSRQALFDWRFVSADGRPPLLSNGMALPVTGAFDNAAGGDMLVIIAGFDQQRHAGGSFLRRLTTAGRKFRTLCGVEAGTWLIARSGLAAGRALTTHYEDFEDFEAAFPELDTRRDRFVADRGLWTAGGASPALDMMLELVSRRHGAALALDIASVFIYDPSHAATDAQPVISRGRLAAREPRLASAIGLMQDTIDNPLPIPAIARRLRLSARMLEVLFARHIGEAPGQYYLAMRLQSARKMAADTNLSMQEIAIRTGFSSQSALSRSFRRRFGQSPQQFRLASHAR